MGSRSRLASLMRLAFSPKYLLFTNTGIGIVFFPAGDMLAQFIEHALGGPPTHSNAPAPGAPPSVAVCSNASGKITSTPLAARKTETLQMSVPPSSPIQNSNRLTNSLVTADAATANVAADEELLSPSEELAKSVPAISSQTSLKSQPEALALGFVYDYQRARVPSVARPPH